MCISQKCFVCSILQHTCCTIAKALHILYLKKYWFKLPEFFQLCSNLAPKDDWKGLECKNANAAAQNCLNLFTYTLILLQSMISRAESERMLLLQHAVAYMQHTSQIAAQCLNQDLLNIVASNFAIGSYLGWRS